MRVSETYIEKGAHHGGELSLVNEILLDYRAYDTVGEATVLFTAVIGVLAVMRRVGRKRGEKPENG